MIISLIYAGRWTDLIWNRFYADSHSFCEFVSVIATQGPEHSTALSPSPSLTFLQVSFLLCPLNLDGERVKIGVLFEAEH